MFHAVLWSVVTVLAVFSAGHALLTKRDPRAAVGWIVLCLFLPEVGWGLYWLLGVNRIRSRARTWQVSGQGIHGMDWEPCPLSAEALETLPFRFENMAALVSLSEVVTRRPIMHGNRIQVLHNGEEAYPAMLSAIADAQKNIYLSTYIFDSDQTGRRFADALCEAADRGVCVHVLVDALGERYSFPPVRHLFRESSVHIARFLPPSLSGRGVHLNLRNHRKILVVDGATGFTGGMNIGDRHCLEGPGRQQVVDIHFQVEGPVVGQMQEAFFEDWKFTTGQQFDPFEIPAPLSHQGAYCRGISAGPNEDFEKLEWLVIGALNCARQSVRIMTPYLIPSRALIAAINTTALRGVKVEIILPRENNLPYVGWAMRAYLWEILQYGSSIYYRPPPFAHSKLLLVDDVFSLIGSSNLDPRSLRLNFEFDLEVYDAAFTTRLAEHFEAVRLISHPLSLEEVDKRPFPQKVLDATAKLFSPYL